MTFHDKVRAVTQFEINEGYPIGSLLNVMLFETAGTLRTDIMNAAGSRAVGLIQFMPSTLAGMGYTTDQVKAMTFDEQLKLVKRYLLPYKTRLLQSKDELDYYLAVLYPVLIGKPDTAMMASDPKTKIYLQNRGLDIDRDGDIQKGDIRKYFYRIVDKIRDRNQLQPVTVTAVLDTFGILIVLFGAILMS